MREDTTSWGETGQLWVNCAAILPGEIDVAELPEKIDGYDLSYAQVQL